MKGYKGFYPGLICEPDSEHKKQYAENTVYEEDKAECCRSGMHFCKYPLNVFGYYPPVTDKGVSEYAEVEALDKPVTDDEENYYSKKLKISNRVNINALVWKSIEYLENYFPQLVKNTGFVFNSKLTTLDNHSLSVAEDKNSYVATLGDYSVANARNRYSKANAVGKYSASVVDGCRSVAETNGLKSVALAEGYLTVATSTGNNSAAITYGHQSVATSMGESSISIAQLDQSISIATGNMSLASAESEDSIALAIGFEGKAKGALGCYIVLAEWTAEDDELDRQLKTVKCHKVDGKTVKPDTWYILKNGKFTEVK